MPAVGRKSRGCVVGKRQLGDAVDGDVVVVVERDEPTEPKVAGQRRRLVTDPLGQAAVARDDEGVVVTDRFAEPGSEIALGDGHADGVGETLPEGARGDLDACRVPDLGVTRRGRSPLTELAEIVEFQPVAGEVEHGVQEDRSVSGRQNQTVTIGPARVARVVFHDSAVEHMGEGSEGHRGALMP